mgnify:CR=1 FL=1
MILLKEKDDIIYGTGKDTDESCMIEGRVAENAIQIENRRIIL